MDLDTFKKANEIYANLTDVNAVIEYITQGDKSHTYKQGLADVVSANKESALLWLNELRVKYETKFNELHCACQSEEPDENSTEQENPK